ncbi:SAM-dependent methyltransferase [Motiliproteus sp.]|uniref:SAM-dependent methyltransferase n=1 Tax=Motiliproteus sp. TaxID=1898955 RepID=UPI003BA91EFD
MSAQLLFIGRIRTPYRTLEACPRNIQVEGPACTLQLKPEYREELRGLRVGQKVLVLYWLGDRRDVVEPDLSPPRWKRMSQASESGLFAMRTPFRPNPIGAAVVPIDAIGEGSLTIRGLDCLDGTALLDIKPAIYRETGAWECEPGTDQISTD